MGRIAVMVLVSTLIDQIVYPEHSPATAADVSTAVLAEELGRMLAAYGRGEDLAAESKAGDTV